MSHELEELTATLNGGESSVLPESVLDAERALTKLASVFFPAADVIEQLSRGILSDWKSRPAADAEVPDVVSRYRILVEQIPAVVFMAFLDKGLSEAYVSPQIEAMLGFTQAEWLNDPVRWYQQIHPDDKSRWSVEAAQTFLSGEPLRSVYRVLARDGRVVWFHCEVRMVRHADGRPWFIHGVGFDITELKQAEEALKQARDSLELRVEERTKELGAANAELQQEIAVRQRAEASLLKAHAELERRVSARTFELARANEYLLSEVGERRRAEDALRKSEDMLLGIFEHAPDTIVVIDRRGRIERVNARVELMFGYKSEELLGRQVEELLPRLFKRRLTKQQRADDDAEPQFRSMGAGLELHGRRKDGGEFPVEVMLSPIAVATGSLVIAIIRDITRRKQSDAALRESADRLKVLSRRLIEVQEAERRRLALELHDEVGQILTGLKLSLEMSTRLPAEEAQASIAQAQTLVNELMARARKMSLDLRPATLDHLGLLSALLGHIKLYSEQTHVRVQFKHSGLEGQRFPAEIETASYRIVQEALTNVARHAETSEAAVLVWADRQSLTIQIEDRGKGFDTEAALASDDTSGLAGMRERAALLGGHFTVESRPGEGTRLTAEFTVGDSPNYTAREGN
ncbi:MAG TPA: PAS domain S-box protein [Pyrinomonadaceae bacterium]|jgi:PAS domain S-box-containing protein|nr:PAS domain S-box protein [Pyrinomonadaceae bacterium]